MITPTVLVESKPWWKSKTVVFNGVAGLVVLLTELTTTFGLPAGITKWLTMAIVICNLVLRFVSNQPVTVSAAPKAVDVPAAPRGMPT